MLDGLQASRKLHNARPHGHAAPMQSQEIYQTPPGQNKNLGKQLAVRILLCPCPKLDATGGFADGGWLAASFCSARTDCACTDVLCVSAGSPTSADAGVLWQRSASAAQPAPDVPGPLPGSPDGAVLWRRDSSGPPSSLVFPRAAEEAPKGLSEGQPGQAAPPQRRVSRASALLDNVAPAAANGIWRPLARQQNGSTAQSGTLSAKPAQTPGKSPCRMSSGIFRSRAYALP